MPDGFCIGLRRRAESGWRELQRVPRSAAAGGHFVACFCLHLCAHAGKACREGDLLFQRNVRLVQRNECIDQPCVQGQIRRAALLHGLQQRAQLLPGGSHVLMLLQERACALPQLGLAAGQLQREHMALFILMVVGRGQLELTQAVAGGVLRLRVGSVGGHVLPQLVQQLATFVHAIVAGMQQRQRGIKAGSVWRWLVVAGFGRVRDVHAGIFGAAARFVLMSLQQPGLFMDRIARLMAFCRWREAVTP